MMLYILWAIGTIRISFGLYTLTNTLRLVFWNEKQFFFDIKKHKVQNVGLEKIHFFTIFFVSSKKILIKILENIKLWVLKHFNFSTSLLFFRTKNYTNNLHIRVGWKKGRANCGKFLRMLWFKNLTLRRFSRKLYRSWMNAQLTMEQIQWTFPKVHWIASSKYHAFNRIRQITLKNDISIKNWLICGIKNWSESHSDKKSLELMFTCGEFDVH